MDLVCDDEQVTAALLSKGGATLAELAERFREGMERALEDV